MKLFKKMTVIGVGLLGASLAKACKKYNLVDGRDVQKMYMDQKPDIVFHLAAAVGGIGVNQKNPGRFFYENAMMNLQVF